MDWNAIKTEYITTDTSYRKLSAKYGVHYNVIGNRSRLEDWQSLRDQYKAKSLSKTINALSTAQANRATRLQDVASKLLDKIELVIDGIDDQRGGARATKDVSDALKNVKDIMMIRSDADVREQEARIAKMQKEAQRDDVQKEPVRVIIEDGASEYSK